MLRAAVALFAVASAAAQQVPPGSLVDAGFHDSRWLQRRLDEFGDAKAFVLFFTTVDCPLVNRYLPRVDRLAADAQARGVVCLGVNVGSDDSLVDAAAQIVELAPQLIAVKDFDLSLAKACGVDRTATAVVLDARRRLCYRGRVDGQYRYTGASPAAARDELRLALEQVLQGQPVEVARTEVQGCAISPPPARAAAAPTFYRDVLPVLQRHCQECHRPQGQAPFALQDYRQVAGKAAMVGEVVAQERMPPWYGSSRHGSFANDRRLDAAARGVLLDWVAAGAPAGAEADAPPPRQWPDAKWRIGEPDQVVKVLAPIRLPADGYVAYKYFVLPFRFEHDTWVEAIEIRAENKAVLHHCNLAHVRAGEFSQDGFITGLVPGGDPMVLDPGTAVRIPAGSALALQAHYVTTGREEVDHLSVGLRFPRVPVQQELRVAIVHDRRFVIPPQAAAAPVRARRTLAEDSVGIGLFVHMHLRGRDMTVTATPPGGGPEVLLVVPNYNFDWQQSYRWAPGRQRFAAGTAIDALAHFDNSAFNPFNPDAAATVQFGLQTADEMMYAFLFYVHEREQLGLQVDPRTGRASLAGSERGRRP